MKNSSQSAQTIDQYISTFPADIQVVLQKIRQVIKNEAPNATEAISYQIPTFKLDGHNLVHFAAFKNHVSLFPGSEAVQVFAKGLNQYKTSKGTIQFPLNQPLPYDLIQAIVMYRVKTRLTK